MKIFDSHVHCRKGCIKYLINIMDIANIEKALILPWPYEDEDILNEAINFKKRIYVAIIPNLELIYDKDLWEKEIKKISKNIDFFDAVKIYKTASFGNIIENDNRDYSNNCFDELWSILSAVNKPVIIHTADPKDFWNNNINSLRKKQIELNPEYNYSGKNIIPREKQKEIYKNHIKKWSNITFIGAHLNGFPADLKELEQDISLNKVDTCSSLEEVLTFDNNKVNDLFSKYYSNILFGTDIMVGEPSEGKESIYYKIWSKFVIDTLDMIRCNDIMRTPNVREYPWSIKGLNLNPHIENSILYENANSLFK